MKSIILCLTILIVSITNSFAATSSEKVTGIYSDMSWNSESGDVSGVEIFIVYSRDGYRIVFRYKPR